MVEAIRSLRVRGAPAIGVAAAFQLAHVARGFKPGTDRRTIERTWSRAVRDLNASRPTAVNLFAATARMDRVFQEHRAQPFTGLVHRLEREARKFFEEDLEMSRRIGRAGAGLIRNGSVWLTHCNAGGLATAGLGTALAVFYEAKRRGRTFSVFADETRPLLQGARLTAWELSASGIPVTVICDNMAGFAMARKRVAGVITGADRIAMNGDAANKIGTFGLAILAKHHGIPFYIAAPATTFDPELADGRGIPIEERGTAELRSFNGRRTVPEKAGTWNPAFDVTPAGLITGFITDRGLIRPPFGRTLKRALFPDN
jgi:methylthioribose-1-phosphate isomerase